MVPLHQHGPNLGANKMIRTAGAEIGQPRRRVRIDELQYFGHIREAANHALLGGDAAAQKGHQPDSNFLPFLVATYPVPPNIGCFSGRDGSR